MKQGTVSVLFGCHSIVHSVIVTISWIKLYGRFPKFWEFICIFIHDLGHWGKDYLTNRNEKEEHWKLGALIAKRLFGEKGYLLTAGHDKHSGVPKSKLYWPDKYSWCIAPRWWLLSNWVVEPKLRRRKNAIADILSFKADVDRNAKNDFAKSTHELFLEDVKKVKDDKHE